MYTLTMCDCDFHDFDQSVIKFVEELNQIYTCGWSQRSFKMVDEEQYNNDINFVQFTFKTIENRIKARTILKKIWHDDNNLCRLHEERQRELEEYNNQLWEKDHEVNEQEYDSMGYYSQPRFKIIQRESKYPYILVDTLRKTEYTYDNLSMCKQVCEDLNNHEFNNQK